MKIKFTRNTALIGIVAGLLLYCILNDCEIREGLSKKKKNTSIMGKLGGIVTSVATKTGKVAADTLKGSAKLAGKGVSVIKTSGKIFTNQSNRKSSI